MKIQNLFVYSLLIVLLIGCDAQQVAYGIVLDKDTRKPLSDILISRCSPKDTNHTDYKEIRSDSIGKFYYKGMGLTSNFDLYFSKSKYSTVKVSYGSGIRPDTIFMIRNSK